MIGAPDTLTIHQLLGRIVYFHALFIAPNPAAQTAGARPEPGAPCCNHGTVLGRPTVGHVVDGSAWSALDEVVAAVPAHHRPCPLSSSACCATCHISSAAAAVASGWAATETRAYRKSEPAGNQLQECSRVAAVRLGRVFAAQHACPCPALEQMAATPPADTLLPGIDELPLTGELLALWADPAATTRQPVASWLNHCTGLADVRRVLETRRTNA